MLLSKHFSDTPPAFMFSLKSNEIISPFFIDPQYLKLWVDMSWQLNVFLATNRKHQFRRLIQLIYEMCPQKYGTCLLMSSFFLSKVRTMVSNQPPPVQSDQSANPAMVSDLRPQVQLGPSTNATMVSDLCSSVRPGPSANATMVSDLRPQVQQGPCTNPARVSDRQQPVQPGTSSNPYRYVALIRSLYSKST